MNLFAEAFFVGKWDPDVGGRRIEKRLQAGENVADAHLRAWRVAREEILANIMRWTRLVIAYFYAYMGRIVHEDRQLHQRLPDELWDRLRNFFERMAGLPCWVDRNLSMTVFGPKQNLDYWEKIFETGKTPTGVQVIAEPLDVNEMIRPRTPAAGRKS